MMVGSGAVQSASHSMDPRSFVIGAQFSKTKTQTRLEAALASSRGRFSLFNVLPRRFSYARKLELQQALSEDLTDIKRSNDAETFNNLIDFGGFIKDLKERFPHLYPGVGSSVLDLETQKSLRVTAQFLRLFVKKQQSYVEEARLSGEIASFRNSIIQAARPHKIDPNWLAQKVMGEAALQREPKEHDHRVWAKLSFRFFGAGQEVAGSGAPAGTACIEDFDLIKREKLVDKILRTHLTSAKISSAKFAQFIEPSSKSNSIDGYSEESINRMSGMLLEYESKVSGSKQSRSKANIEIDMQIVNLKLKMISNTSNKEDANRGKSAGIG